MSKIPEMIPISDFRQDAAAVLKRVRSADEPVVVTQRGRAAAVMLSVAAYERREQARELLELLVRGEREIASGVGHGLDEVLAEADTLLADHAE